MRSTEPRAVGHWLRGTTCAPTQTTASLSSFATDPCPVVRPSGCAHRSAGVAIRHGATAPRKQTRGKVIAIDIDQHFDLSTTLQPSDQMFGWRQMWHSLTPWGRRKRRIPNILRILHRTATITSVQARQRASVDADLYLHPPVEAFGVFDFKAYRKIAEAGYEYGLREFGRWLRVMGQLAPAPDDPAARQDVHRRSMRRRRRLVRLLSMLLRIDVRGPAAGSRARCADVVCPVESGPSPELGLAHF